MGDSELHILSTSATMSGDEVLNAAGEKIGEIKDFRVDLDKRCIAYAILSFGNYWSTKLLALPWNALQVDAKAHCFIVDIDKVVLENAPGFDPGDWPRQPDREFINHIYTYFGYDPYYDESNAFASAPK